MRTCLAFFSLLFIPFSLAAQIDPGMQAAQDAQLAAQQSQQATMQAMQQASEAAQQATQDSQASVPGPCCVGWTAPPKFSMKAGKYNGLATVKITDGSRGAVIYYSTDGWSPTVNSPRYRGPVRIDSTTTLQAIAIAPYSARSVVTSAQYVIVGTPANSATVAAVSPSPATAGGPANLVAVPLVFGATVSSKTASVGDKVPMTLSQDLQLGDLVIKKVPSPPSPSRRWIAPASEGHPAHFRLKRMICIPRVARFLCKVAQQEMEKRSCPTPQY